jgi:TonB family protein
MGTAYRIARVLSAAALVVATGCARERRATPPAAAPLAIPVDVRADTAALGTLRVAPPGARVWVASVSPTRPAPPLASTPLPEAAPDSAPLDEPRAAPALTLDDRLKPPILRTPVTLTVPPGARRARVELDVNVDEEGRVTDVEWAAGARDSALVTAARRCAYAMRFHPAERAGRPVAVWCRQCFDFDGTGAAVPAPAGAR